MNNDDSSAVVGPGGGVIRTTTSRRKRPRYINNNNNARTTTLMRRMMMGNNKNKNNDDGEGEGEGDSCHSPPPPPHAASSSFCDRTNDRHPRHDGLEYDEYVRDRHSRRTRTRTRNSPSLAVNKSTHSRFIVGHMITMVGMIVALTLINEFGGSVSTTTPPGGSSTTTTTTSTAVFVEEEEEKTTRSSSIHNIHHNNNNNNNNHHRALSSSSTSTSTTSLTTKNNNTADSDDVLLHEEDEQEDTVTVEEEEEEEEVLSVDVSFEDIMKTVIFLLTSWMMSMLSEFVGLPRLVGEIVTGFILGPPLLDFVAFPEAMALLGSFGLIGLLLDSGINLDIAQLRETGSRAVALAFVGTILALGVGLGMGYASFTYYQRDSVDTIDMDPTSAADDNDNEWFRSSFAVGAAFAPSSFGVASQVLSKGEILNTPMGQVIVAASVTDDILGLILLSIMEVLVMTNPRVVDYIIPFLSSFGYLIVLGYVGITYFPKWIEQYVLPRFANKQSRDFVGFSLLFILLAFYLPLMYYSGASYLTGAFLAGLSFSQIKSVHTQYLKSGPHLKIWLMRIFFSATIGFQVPVQYFTNGNVLNWGFLYVLPVLAKLPLGLMVPRITRELPDDFPYNPYWKDVIITTLSFTCRGEFNFIVAAFALGAGVLDPEQYAAVVFAILLSAVFCPLVLTKVIRYYNDKFKVYISGRHKIKHIDGNSTDGTRPLFLAIQARTPVTWGIQEKFDHALESAGLLVIDHRSWHTLGMDAVDITEIFCQDTVASIRVRRAFKNSNNSNHKTSSIRTPQKDRKVLLNSTLRSFEDGEEAFVDDSDSDDGSKICPPDKDYSRMDTPNTASTFSTIIESPSREQLAMMEDTEEQEEDERERDEIELRKQIVRDALVECLGHDVDPATYAIVVTQWQAVVTYDSEDVEETAAGSPGTYIGRGSERNLGTSGSIHGTPIRQVQSSSNAVRSRRRNDAAAGYRFVAPPSSVAPSSTGILDDRDNDFNDLEHQQGQDEDDMNGESDVDEEEERNALLSSHGIIDNIDDFDFDFDFIDQNDDPPPMIPSLNDESLHHCTDGGTSNNRDVVESQQDDVTPSSFKLSNKSQEGRRRSDSLTSSSIVDPALSRTRPVTQMSSRPSHHRHHHRRTVSAGATYSCSSTNLMSTTTAAAGPGPIPIAHTSLLHEDPSVLPPPQVQRPPTIPTNVWNHDHRPNSNTGSTDAAANSSTSSSSSSPRKRSVSVGTSTDHLV